MRNPLIITIGREYGSGGREIGELVAKTLGIAYYDKKLITLAAQKSGLSDEFIANNEQRVRSGFKAGLVMSFAVALVFMGAYVFCGENLLLLFMNSTSAEAIEIGKKFLLIVSLCYLFLALKLAADGVLRGAGAMVYFMITTFLDLILRVVLAFILVHPFGITGIWLSWPFGWVISSTLSLAFYLFGVWNPLKKKA